MTTCSEAASGSQRWTAVAPSGQTVQHGPFRPVCGREKGAEARAAVFVVRVVGAWCDAVLGDSFSIRRAIVRRNPPNNSTCRYAKAN